MERKDLYGFDASTSTTTLSSQQLKEKERNDRKFLSFLSNLDNDTQKILHPSHENYPSLGVLCGMGVTLEDCVRSGFPAAFRPFVWKRLVVSCLSGHEVDDDDDDDVEIPENIKTQIINDVDRTFPNHTYFRTDGDRDADSGQGMAKLQVRERASEIFRSAVLLSSCRWSPLVVSLLSTLRSFRGCAALRSSRRG